MIKPAILTALNAQIQHELSAEQVEEEQWSGELAALTGQLHERPGALFLLDHQWGKRVEENSK